MTRDERRQKIVDYQKTFLSAEGRNVLADLSSQCNEKRTTFVKNDPYTTAFLEGARAIILYIRRLIEAKPEEPEPTQALTEEDHDDA